MLTISAMPLIKRIISLAMLARGPPLPPIDERSRRQIPQVAQAQVALDDLQAAKVLALVIRGSAFTCTSNRRQGSTNTQS